MTLFYYDPRFLEHDTGGRHPERPERLIYTMRHLERVGLDCQVERPAWQPMSPEGLALVHAPEYVAAIEQFSAEGGGRVEEDTIASRQSYDVACLAAGAVADAVERIASGPQRQALCLVRPPGHHALRDAAMGFCLFNNVAVGARTATRRLGIDRVLVVDFDVHHGNGTQAIFWDDPRVGFLSIHRWPFYPGTGAADETGGGDAVGTKVNLPVPFGIARSDYLEHFTRALEWVASKTRPELILVSAGFDAHRDDPVGSLGLETEDFGPLTSVILDAAAAYAGGRVVSVLEGGYNTSALAGSVALHLETLLQRERAQ